MDLSKLPKLSESPAPPPPVQDETPAPAPQPIDYGHGPTIGVSIGAEVWVSLIIGIIFLMLGFNFARYAFTTMSGHAYHTHVDWTDGPKAGTEVAYPDLTGDVIWNDSALFIFGVALILEAIVLFIAGTNSTLKRPLVGFAAFIAAAATLLNLIAAAKMFSDGIMPLVSLLAVAFGGYMAAYEWKLYVALRPRPAPSLTGR